MITSFKIIRTAKDCQAVSSGVIGRLGGMGDKRNSEIQLSYYVDENRPARAK